MNDDRTGGPAFPNHAEWPGGDGLINSIHWKGMTLRVYLAAAALPGLIPVFQTTRMEVSVITHRIDIDGLVQTAFQVADEMLKARES